MIGKLQELILMACVRAGPEALPSEIYERVSDGRPGAAFGAVYTTLGRMAGKAGLVEESVKVDEAGRERRAFTVTQRGRAELAAAVRATAVIGGYQIGGGFDVALT